MAGIDFGNVKEMSMYGQRGVRKAVPGRRIMVEGETLLVTEIASRLGVSRSTAQKRLKRARTHPAVTWELLK